MGERAEALESRAMLAVVSWNGDNGTLLWSDPLNWSDNEVPTADDDVTVSVENGQTIVATTAVSMKSITTTGAGTIRFNSNVTVGSGGATLASNVILDGLTFSSTGTIAIGTSFSNTLAIIGGATTVQTTAGSITLNSTTAVNQNFTLSAGGSSSDLIISAGTTGITGASDVNISLNADRTVRISENVTAMGTGTITVSGNSNSGARDIVINSGAVVSVADGNLTLDADIGSQMSGQFLGVNVNGAVVQSTGSGNVRAGQFVKLSSL